MYKLWDKQGERYFADGTDFETMQEIRQTLVGFHSMDVSARDLKKMRLCEILEAFGWEVHDLDGEVVVVKV